MRRTIKRIDKVSFEDLCGATRSPELPNIEDLLYIVEFESGAGSAILGADYRLEPVYAVLDNSVLTAEDFNNAIEGKNEDDISTFMAGTIAESII